MKGLSVLFAGVQRASVKVWIDRGEKVGGGIWTEGERAVVRVRREGRRGARRGRPLERQLEGIFARSKLVERFGMVFLKLEVEVEG